MKKEEKLSLALKRVESWNDRIIGIKSLYQSYGKALTEIWGTKISGFNFYEKPREILAKHGLGKIRRSWFKDKAGRDCLRIGLTWNSQLTFYHEKIKKGE